MTRCTISSPDEQVARMSEAKSGMLDAGRWTSGSIGRSGLASAYFVPEVVVTCRSSVEW